MPKTKADYIPAISAARLEALAAQTKPLVTRDNQLRYVELKGPQLKNTAFTWAEDNLLGAVAKGLEPFRTIVTYHVWAYYGFFKPSADEVLAQFDAQLTPEEIAQVVAYSTEGPSTYDDLGKHQEVFDAGLHYACTTLYRTA